MDYDVVGDCDVCAVGYEVGAYDVGYLDDVSDVDIVDCRRFQGSPSYNTGRMLKLTQFKSLSLKNTVYIHTCIKIHAT